MHFSNDGRSLSSTGACATTADAVLSLAIGGAEAAWAAGKDIADPPAGIAGHCAAAQHAAVFRAPGQSLLWR